MASADFSRKVLLRGRTKKIRRVPILELGGLCLSFHRFAGCSYATAQLIPNAVPTAARIADARFHKKRISLVLFS